ncbi:MAG: hypothetical protein IKG81_09055 [Bacteroidales bacterium]|nr:hypothetical protein [Bacteroidales bacterium]
MKKKGLLFALLVALFASTSFAQQTRIISVINESNGRQPWWDILEVAKARYSTVKASVSFQVTPDGEYVEIHRLDCEDPGNVKCRWSSVDRTPSPISFNGFSISRTTIDNLTDEMLDEIDGILYSSEQSTGTVSRTLSIWQNNQLLIILLTARWINGNANCDANITIEIKDITQFVDLY